MPSGSARPGIVRSSGMAPPEVIAARRAPRRRAAGGSPGRDADRRRRVRGRRDAVGEHLQDGIEILAREVAIRIRPPNQSKSSSSSQSSPAAGSHDLLGQNIERRARNLHPVQIARADRAHQRHALEQFVARGGEEAALRAAPPPSGPSGPRAATPPRSSAASRSGTPDRQCRCRSPAPARPWRPSRAVRPP